MFFIENYSEKKSNAFAKKLKISIIYKAKKKAKICEVADTHG